MKVLWSFLTLGTNHSITQGNNQEETKPQTSQHIVGRTNNQILSIDLDIDIYTPMQAFKDKQSQNLQS